MEQKVSRTWSVGRGCWRLLVLAFQAAVLSLILAFIVLFIAYGALSHQLAGAIDQVVAYEGSGPGGTPRFFDRHGELLFELETVEKRRWLSYDEIPTAVISATVAVEDDTFWENPGFDPAAIGAAAVAYARQDGSTRPAGASTITQQLVRHIAFDYEERLNISVERKVREIFLAFILTRQRSKEDIITMYLNEIYYGNLAYGIEAAAQTYFDRPAAELSLAEVSFLVGLPQAPAELDPYIYYEAARARQKWVLALMAAEGMFAADDAARLEEEPLALAPRIRPNAGADAVLEAPHFIIYLQNQLEQRYGPTALSRGGWQITTTLDLGIQKLVEQAVREQVTARAAHHNVNNGAAVVLKPATGEILALVGSVDYWNEQIDGQVNVALQPRQPGSAIKPITYAAAMERGWNGGDVLWDVPIVIDLGNGRRFEPVNYDRRFHGPLLFRDALANSYNIPPVQLIRDIGIGTMITMARRMGVSSLTRPANFYGLTLALGGGDVRLLELTHAYATLANMGRRPPLTGVLEIVDSRGRHVFKQRRTPAANALDPRIAYIITDILDDDAARAPAMGFHNALNLPFPAAAKTGTTNDWRDNWTIGYTPGLVAGVWFGNTDGRPMQDSSGLRGAAPVWRRIVEGVYANPALFSALEVEGQPPPAEFVRPQGLVEKTVCLPRGTGGARCTATRSELFLATAPQHGIARLGYVPDSTTQPGAWRLRVLPLPRDAAQHIQRPALAGGEQPPQPTHCVVNGSASLPAVQERLYLPIPPYYADEVRARLWLRATGAGYRMAPPTVCPLDVVRADR
ncbi:MAG: transglycosylase domain-containing protein [Candidatus Promineifilaceae bacterium]|nr:transglycosylase domain-containing protein [Candidatus Promineifilaceae bacterium]